MGSWCQAVTRARCACGRPPPSPSCTRSGVQGESHTNTHMQAPLHNAVPCAAADVLEHWRWEHETKLALQGCLGVASPWLVFRPDMCICRYLFLRPLFPHPPHPGLCCCCFCDILILSRHPCSSISLKASFFLAGFTNGARAAARSSNTPHTRRCCSCHSTRTGSSALRRP